MGEGPNKVLYVGQDGFVVAVCAQGELVKKFDGVRCFLSGEGGGTFVNISALKTRSTDRYVVDLTKESEFATVYYPKPPTVFPYYTQHVGDDMATWQHMQTLEVNSIIAMPLRVTSVELKDRRSFLFVPRGRGREVEFGGWGCKCHGFLKRRRTMANRSYVLLERIWMASQSLCGSGVSSRRTSDGASARAASPRR